MAAPDVDPWVDTANRVREEVVQRPYLALVVGGGIGCLLAVVLRALPRVVSLGLPVALASMLPTLTEIIREVDSREA